MEKRGILAHDGSDEPDSGESLRPVGGKVGKVRLSARNMVALALAVAILGLGALSRLSSQTNGGVSSEQSSAATSAATSTATSAGSSSSGVAVTEDGTYTSKDEVALYIHTYGHLPSNYISKTKARAAGWDASEGNLDDVCPGKSIGGSQYYDDDGALPSANGRTWTECDIDYAGGYRGAERIIFSNDGLVYYTGDHYQTFERLY